MGLNWNWHGANVVEKLGSSPDVVGSDGYI